MSVEAIKFRSSKGLVKEQSDLSVGQYCY